MKGKQRVHEEADERSAPSAHVVYEAIRLEGEEELERRVSSLAWSAFAAGLSMGFSFVSEGLLQRYLPAATWSPLIVKLGYSVGFLIVILGRQQLFTENTLTAILPLLVRKSSRILLRVLRLWSIVFAANIAGALLFAFVLAKTKVLDPEIHRALDQVANDAMAQDFGVTLLRGIFAGWLIALMVWLLPVAEAARIWVIIILTYLIGVGHFPHIIAGSIETFYLGVSGLRSWGEVLGGYALPTLIGNTIGGVALVAALAHAQIAGDKEKQREGS
ncbi:MAG: formate/nitrite transporter family protein [Candidatus Eremiobacteraeota bacterium]|nr:formate/nitrite transporter family protein [Candidatus Eremiobacteraeota bacterium]